MNSPPPGDSATTPAVLIRRTAWLMAATPGAAAHALSVHTCTPEGQCAWCRIAGLPAAWPCAPATAALLALVISNGQRAVSRRGGSPRRA
ncbi:MAG TPA: hypothetical protein VE196_09300 [Pseudonocardiaceae bacterium]|nr:hypothetical protein [Pseudonocardiaceae bacterium]